MSFLNGLAKGLHRAFDGNGLAVTQAILAGDYQAAGALRARQEALQRDNAIRDAQVIGAKNLGLSGDEIAAMSPEALSWAVYQRGAARGFGPGGGLAAGATEGEAGDDASPYAPPPGRPPQDPTFTLTSGRFSGSPEFGGSAPQQGGGLQAATFPGGSGAQIAGLGNVPRAQSHAQAAALPRGSYFFAPDASLRRII